MDADRSQKPLSMRELFPPSMLQNGGRQIRFCHVVSRPASLLAENFSLKIYGLSETNNSYCLSRSKFREIGSHYPHDNSIYLAPFGENVCNYSKEKWA